VAQNLRDTSLEWANILLSPQLSCTPLAALVRVGRKVCAVARIIQHFFSLRLQWGLLRNVRVVRWIVPLLQKCGSISDTIAAAALYILDAFHGVLPVIILCRANSSIWADVKWCVTVNYIDRFGLVVALVVAISLVVRPPNATGSSS